MKKKIKYNFYQHKMILDVDVVCTALHHLKYAFLFLENVNKHYIYTPKYSDIVVEHL